MSADFTIYATQGQLSKALAATLHEGLMALRELFTDGTTYLGSDLDEISEFGLARCAEDFLGGELNRFKVVSKHDNATLVVSNGPQKFYFSIWATNEVLKGNLAPLSLIESTIWMITKHIVDFRDFNVSNPQLDQSISMQQDIPYYFIPNITLNWKTVMAPHYYEEFWDLEVLLRAPAFAVRELENGWIELQTYRDLFDPLSEESLLQVRRLACYLEKYHKNAWDSIQNAPQLYEGGDKRPGCVDCGYE